VRAPDLPPPAGIDLSEPLRDFWRRRIMQAIADTWRDSITLLEGDLRDPVPPGRRGT